MGDVQHKRWKEVIMLSLDRTTDFGSLNACTDWVSIIIQYVELDEPHDHPRLRMLVGRPDVSAG